MLSSAAKCLTALLCFGCQQPFVELDTGSAIRWIAGVVADSVGTPVVDVDVQGFHTGVENSECHFLHRPGFRGWPTDEHGRYRARISEVVLTGGSGPRCLFLEFVPPEASRLRPVALDSLRVHMYDGEDLAWQVDTLFINVVLPEREE